MFISILIKELLFLSKFFLLDSFFEGHHTIYLNTLLKLEDTVNISKKFDFCDNMINFYRYIQSRQNFLYYGINKCNSKDGNKLLHFLYFDSVYTIPKITEIKKTNNLKIIGTLHRLPDNKLKILLLKNMSKKIDLIIVHSEYSKEYLNANGINNVEVIDYPVFHSQKLLSKKKNLLIPQQKIVLSALGGTRWDKGLDILLESFKYISDNYKNKIVLNVAGKEESFKADYILKKSKEYNFNVNLKLKFLTDDEFAEMLEISDALVIPYRKVFTGSSGPMTEAIYRNIPCIVSNHGNIGYLIKKYDLGFTFKSEDPKDLAEKIQYLLINGWNGDIDKSNEYRRRLKVDNFLDRHREIYNSLLGEDI